ncbi:MAG: hypothetical protein R2855_10950 [Thermomicrobiales bacterium]
MLALSRSDLKQLVPMKDAVELMKIAFQELSEGRAEAPVRAVVDVNDDPSAMLMMPGYVPASHALGFKVVNFFAGNPSKRGLPTLHAIVCLIDDVTGEPLGVMEGGFVTALRTGAVSGAASDLMARPDSSVLTVIGAGVQGVTQAAAVCAVRPIGEDHRGRYQGRAIGALLEHDGRRLARSRPRWSSHRRGIRSR